MSLLNTGTTSFTSIDPKQCKIDLSMSTIDADVHQIVAAAAAAEEAGFDGVWAYDHISGAVFGGNQVIDVWTALAAIAVATTKVTVGPLVVNTTTRHPAHIHTAVVTLQQLCRGRAMVGLGAGAGAESTFSSELAMFGIPALPAATRRERVTETAQMLSALWIGDEKYRGSHFRYDSPHGIALPNPIPKIIVGANGPRMAAVAGQVADGVNLYSWESTLPTLIAAARDSLSSSGRPKSDISDFEISVEGPLTAEWLDAGSEQRQRLAALGVTRLQLRWNAAMTLQAINDAAPYLVSKSSRASR